MNNNDSPISPKNRGIIASGIFSVFGLLVWLLILLTGQDEARAWRALLVNFIYATPLAAGLVTWSAIVTAANGQWAGETERLAWRGMGFLVPSVVLLIGLWAGSPSWAPWYGTELHQGAWLNNTFLFARELAGLLIFRAVAVWFLAQRARSRQAAMMPAAVLIIVYCIVFTFFAFDFVMALLPEWRSAIFGGYFFISSLYLAVVFWTFLAVISKQSPEEVRHDMGKLVLAFSILTTSLLYMQLLTIWYENFPDETSYLIQRMHFPGWKIVSLFIVLVVYLGPLAMLLTERAKKSRKYLGAVSALLLVGLWIERWWMIAPTFSPEIQFGLVELAATAGVSGLFGLSTIWTRNFLPLLPKEERAVSEMEETQI